MAKLSENATKRNIHTVSLVVANKPGVLVRIAQVFARRGFNIDSLVVSPTVDPKFSSMTITSRGDAATLDQIIKQSAKLIDVIHVSEHKPEEAMEVELALYKVKGKSVTKVSISKSIKSYQAQIIDIAQDSIIIQQIGSTEELDTLEAILKKYGLVEMVRTGKVVMARGKEST